MLEPQLCRPRPEGAGAPKDTNGDAGSEGAWRMSPRGVRPPGEGWLRSEGPWRVNGKDVEARAVENVAEARKSVVTGQAFPLTSRGSETAPRRETRVAGKHRNLPTAKLHAHEKQGPAYSAKSNTRSLLPEPDLTRPGPACAAWPHTDTDPHRPQGKAGHAGGWLCPWWPCRWRRTGGDQFTGRSSMSPFPFSLPLIKMKKWGKSSPNRMNKARGDT